jgi:hypothetical protein
MIIGRTRRGRLITPGGRTAPVMMLNRRGTVPAAAVRRGAVQRRAETQGVQHRRDDQDDSAGTPHCDQVYSAPHPLDDHRTT